MTNILGWIGNILFVYGVYGVSKKNISGLYGCALANFLYIVRAQILSDVPLLVLSIILCSINIYGIYNWSKDAKKV